MGISIRPIIYKTFWRKLMAKKTKIPEGIWISMDPGDNTGLALWDKDKLVKTYTWKLIGKEKNLSEAERQGLMNERFRDVLRSLPKPSQFIIEGVNLWGQSAKSQAAALRGDTFRLAYLVGSYIETYRRHNKRGKVEIITVQSWKGNLPTDILINETITFCKDSKLIPNEHVACAVGIGMAQIGKL